MCLLKSTIDQPPSHTHSPTPTPPHHPSYGPRDPDRRDPFSPDGRLAVDFRAAGAAASAAHAAVGDRGGRGATPAEREAASLIAAALLPAVRVSEFSRLTADVAITIVDGWGGATDRAAAILAASLALADAGVPMTACVGAASFARVGGRVLLDPSPAEEAAADGGGLVAALVAPSAPDRLTQAVVTGSWGADALEGALDAAAAAAAAVGGLAREVLLASVK